MKPDHYENANHAKHVDVDERARCSPPPTRLLDQRRWQHDARIGRH
jgi:hypothetical protein